MLHEKNIHQIFKLMEKTVLDISLLGKGEASTVYKVVTNSGIYALKTALYPERKKKVLHEAEFRKFFIDNSMDCIPPPVLTDESIFPNGAVIYEFVEGSYPDFNDFDIIKQFAQITSKLHKIKYEVEQEGFRNIEKLFSFIKKITQKITTKYSHLMNKKIESAFDIAIKEFKEMLPFNSTQGMIGINAQLHGDLSDNFVIDKNNKVWLLDWENSEYGDIVEEICWLLSVNDFTKDQRAIFFQEYQKHFPITKKIQFEDLYSLYAAANEVLNICWGVDQLDMNIKQKLEPERKLRDLAITANNWKKFYSVEASSLIIDGITILIEKIS